MLKHFLLVLACLAVAPGAYALCFASPSGNPICQEFWQYDAVFDGTVTSIQQERGVAGAEWIGLREVHRVVTFEVHRTWRGESARSVQLVLPGGDGLWVEDTLEVKQGLRYVIFAGRMPGGHLSASGCGPSALFERSKDALAFLESLSRPASGGRIFGIVYDTTKRSEGAQFPAVEAELVLEGKGLRRVTRSKGGSFEFVELRPGRYKLSILPGRRSVTYEKSFEITLTDAHACAGRDFPLQGATR